ncbi:hypothetical protein EO244_05750 [Ancylomarina salipaludis]|uniref:Uncharacterized protein n=1 Tax=Ancylomarina salipaludis TaxID=2501299 RepID=A0A4Q1JMP5_9BACT|nr:hypothetical protein [Ancylomarina salipaludis]RXQ95812.1 hypothetical protein EO244_05750 [Ancylomarina salipaludis]
MTTVKGVMRSYGAAVRRIERDQQRQAREAAKRFKEQQKLKEIDDARQAVEDWENYVNMIQSVHKDCCETIDWDKIQKTQPPKEPTKRFDNEKFAKEKLDSFKPSFFDKLFGSTEKKIDKLKKQIETARRKDETDNESRHNQYQEDLKDWQELQRIADGVKNGEIEAYKNAIEYYNLFSEIGELGTHLNINFESKYLDVDLSVNSDEVIPNYELRQTATGKLSKKNMAKGKFNELYQDHICSSVIRVAREIFAYLPLEFIRVNAMAEILNSATGHLENQPILSIILPPVTIEKLNLKTIDPSDSMQNFVHNMKFSKTKGFDAVDKVELIN